jgi:hypothetical protein
MDDEKPNHHDSSPTSRFVRLPLVSVLCDDHSNDDVASSHTNGANREDRLSAELVDVEHGWDSCDEHDDADDTCSE